MLTDVPILLQIASSLPHEPDWPDVGRPAAACVKKAACHWGHAHRSLIAPYTVTTKRLWALLSLEKRPKELLKLDPLACSFDQVSTRTARGGSGNRVFFLPRPPALDSLEDLGRFRRQTCGNIRLEVQFGHAVELESFR